VHGASVTPTTAAVDGLALYFGGSAGSRAEISGIDVGPEAFPALTMGCWVRAEAGFGAGFAGSSGDSSYSDEEGGHLRSLLSGSAASEFDRALGLRATGSTAGSAGGSLGPAGWSLNTGRAYEENMEAQGAVAGNSDNEKQGVLPVRYGQWSFVAAVYDQASRSAMLYVDGHSVTYERTLVGKGRGLGLLVGGSGTVRDTARSRFNAVELLASILKISL